MALDYRGRDVAGEVPSGTQRPSSSPHRKCNQVHFDVAPDGVVVAGSGGLQIFRASAGRGLQDLDEKRKLARACGPDQLVSVELPGIEPIGLAR